MTVAATGAEAAGIETSGSLSVPGTLRRFAPLLLVATVFGVAASLAAPYPVGIFHDDGVYLILAKALASGEGYRYLHLPGAPLATHYPPLYPLLLAALWKIGPAFPGNISLLLLANAALLAWTASSVDRFARERLGWPRWLTGGVALAGTLSLPLVMLSSLVMSEVLFVALAVHLLGIAERRLDVGAAPSAHDVLLGLAGGALALVRAHAIALPLAVVALLLWRRRWRRAAMCAAGTVLALAPWQIWVGLHDAALVAPLRGAYGSYLGWFAGGLAQGGVGFVWRTVALNAREIAALLADRLAPWPPGPLRILPLALIVVLVAVGATRLWRRAPVTVGFLTLYFAATLAWPYAPWRFVWAVWPLLLVLVVAGGIAVLETTPRVATPAWRLAAIALVAVVSLGAARAEIGAYTAMAWRAPVRNAARQIAPIVRWVADSTAPDDILVADDEPLVYLMTGRRAVPPAAFTALEYLGQPASPSAAARTLRDLIGRYHPRYVLTVVPATRNAARQLTHDQPRPLLRERQELAGGAGAVFEIVR